MLTVLSATGMQTTVLAAAGGSDGVVSSPSQAATSACTPRCGSSTQTRLPQRSEGSQGVLEGVLAAPSLVLACLCCLYHLAWPQNAAIARREKVVFPSRHGLPLPVTRVQFCHPLQATCMPLHSPVEIEGLRLPSPPVQMRMRRR